MAQPQAFPSRNLESCGEKESMHGSSKLDYTSTPSR